MPGVEKKATLGELLVSFTVGHQCAILYVCVITELPILVQRLPEYWNLPVIVGFEFTVMTALVSGIVLALMKLTTVIDVLHRHVPAMLLSLGCLKVILLTLMMTFWDSTSTVYGKKYSIAFQIIWVLMISVITLDFLFGLPYVGTFPQKCVPAFYVGIYCSGTIYGFITFLQGAGEFDCVNKTENANQSITNLLTSQNPDNTKDWNESLDLSKGWQEEIVFRKPSFTVETYFSILIGISLCCCALLLGHVVSLRLQQSNDEVETTILINQGDADASNGEGSAEQLAETDNRKELKYQTCEIDKQRSEEQNAAITTPERNLVSNCRVHAIIVMGYSCLLDGIDHGAAQPLMTYAALPYGTLTFGLSRRLSSAVEPLGTILYVLFPTKSLQALSFIFGTYVTLCVYVCVVAVMSPTPPLVSTQPEIGSALVVSSYILLPMIRCYLLPAFGTIAAELGQNTLKYYSLAQHVSMVVLAIPSLVCIDVLKLLTEVPQCS